MKILNRIAKDAAGGLPGFSEEADADSGPGCPENLSPHFGNPAFPGIPRQRVFLGSTFIAGYQHHHGMHPRVFWSLRPGEELQVVREPGNPYDPLAVALYTPEGARLGYLPHGLNEPVAHIIDQGNAVRVLVEAVEAEAEPWKRVRVYLCAEFPAPIVYSEN